MLYFYYIIFTQSLILMITSTEYALNLARRRASFIDYTIKDVNENQLNTPEFNNYNNQTRRLTSGCKNLSGHVFTSGYLTTQLLDYNDKRFNSEDNIVNNKFPDTNAYPLIANEKLLLADTTTRAREFTSSSLRNSRVPSRNHSKSPMQSGTQSRKSSILVSPHSPTIINWNE